MTERTPRFTYVTKHSIHSGTPVRLDTQATECSRRGTGAMVGLLLDLGGFQNWWVRGFVTSCIGLRILTALNPNVSRLYTVSCMYLGYFSLYLERRVDPCCVARVD